MSNKQNLLDLMASQNINQLAIDTFFRYYEQLKNGFTGMLDKTQITAPAPQQVAQCNQLQQTNQNLWNQLVVVKLNGGLGTSMGLTKAKSLLPVKGNHTFLDIIARQIMQLRTSTGCQVPLLLMDSFNTQQDTLDHLKAYPQLSVHNLPLDFLQNKFPKLRKSDLSALNNPDDNKNWNPPGHGDIYTALSTSGLLDKLLDLGYRYMFVSNSDNLGATADLRLLTHFANSNLPFMMEVCQRTPMDKKGGHLAAYKTGGLVLRESAQCPKDEVDEFQNINLYSYFNTNNLWVNLQALKDTMSQNDGVMPLPLILNPKNVDGTDVYQLETAMGAAISVFDNSGAVLVPRSRFAPVKKTNDLLVVWSDVYTLQDDWQIVLANGLSKTPVVNLDPDFFATVHQLKQHCPGGAPSLLNCSSLDVTGDVYFGPGLAFSGDVTLKAGRKLELANRTITGNQAK